ncbi:MAG: hypothetical protein KatS3mg110_1905 [Pirellulaceae bacterium]|nr:MAG: hypothetical protein KatS3mg110_1905 [Pirellulaceae bacterium]
MARSLCHANAASPNDRMRYVMDRRGPDEAESAGGKAVSRHVSPSPWPSGRCRVGTRLTCNGMRSVWLAAACAFLSLSGCQWFTRPSANQSKSAEQIIQEQQERERKLREAQQKPLVVGPLRFLPHNQSDPQLFVKPGHILAGQQSFLANREDLGLELTTRAVSSSNQPLDWTGTMYHATWQRSIALPKKQEKLVDLLFFLPATESNSADTTRFYRPALASDIRVKSNAKLDTSDQQPVLLMPAYQYHMVVLAQVPESYAFVQRLSCVADPVDEFILSQKTFTYYRVQIPNKLEQFVPLPPQWYAWTSVAYLIWDGIAPDLLTPDQQQALLDWLYFGGQLIISGPGSSEKLAGSFLEPYLPAARAGAVRLHEQDFEELNQHWTLPGKKSEPLKLARGEVAGVRLEPAPHGQFVQGTGRLVCEGRVGRGRIVITAFSLVERDLLRWPSYDGFWNAVLLRRPARRFLRPEFQMSGPAVKYERYSITDPRFATRVRYFARDTEGPIPSNPLFRDGRAAPDTSADLSVEDRAWQLVGFDSRDAVRSLDLESPGPEDTGIGGWWDKSGVAQAARSVLREASGIKVPQRSFVLQILAVYLVVLVPVNWAFFRLLGRVEWAWFAAPFLALAGAAIVTRLTQLDIGFARSRCEIAFLEAHAGYPRAHLARYTALYASLSTQYRLHSENGSLIVLPFADDPPFHRRPHDPQPEFRLKRDRDIRVDSFTVQSNTTSLLHGEEMLDLGGSIDWLPDPSNPLALVIANRTTLGPHDPQPEFRLKRDRDVRVDSFTVQSNTTSLLHGEEMLDLGGSIDWLPDPSNPLALVVANHTTFTIRDAIVYGSDEKGNWVWADVGDMPPGAERQIVLQPTSSLRTLPAWKGNPVLGPKSDQDALGESINLRSLAEVVIHRVPPAPGELTAGGMDRSALGEPGDSSGTEPMARGYVCPGASSARASSRSRAGREPMG